MTTVLRLGLLGALAAAIVLASSPAATVPKGPVQLPGAAGCVSEGGQGGCTPGHMLDGAAWVVVSPDGRHVYVGSIARRIAVFERDTRSGALRQLEGAAGCVAEAGAGGCTSASGLEASGPVALSAGTIALSPDGRHLYTLGYAVLSFARDESTGALTQVAGPQGCIVVRSSSLACQRSRPSSALLPAIAFDRTGTLVALATHLGSDLASEIRHGVMLLRRDPATGSLVQLDGTAGCVESRGLDGCSLGDRTSLYDLEAVALAPDGSFLVAANDSKSALRAFGRSSAGAITPAGCVVFGSFDEPGCTRARQSRAPDELLLSADGTAIYGSSTVFRGVNAFSLAGGAPAELSSPETMRRGSGRQLPVGLALSPDGRYLYAGNHGLLTFSRAADGSIAQLPGEAGCVVDAVIAQASDGCAKTARSLLGGSGVAVSPDGRHVYVASADSDAVAVFAAPDEVGPKVTVGPARTKVTKGKASLAVACPADEVRCSGTVSLLLGKAKIGSATWSAGGGLTAKVGVPLSAAARKQLAAKRSLGVIAQVVATDLHGNATRAQRPLALLA